MRVDRSARTLLLSHTTSAVASADGVVTTTTPVSCARENIPTGISPVPGGVSMTR